MFAAKLIKRVGSARGAVGSLLRSKSSVGSAKADARIVLDEARNKNIAFIGAGNMAQAFITGLVGGGHSKDKILVSDPSHDLLQLLTKDQGVKAVSTNLEAVAAADIVFLAVKPHIVPVVLEEIKPALSDSERDSLIVSIASGVKVCDMDHLSGGGKQVVRAMTNTPAQVGKGCSVLCANESVTAENRSLVEYVFESTGTVSWTEESMLDTYTAFMGCGPAYFYLLAEELGKAAITLGIPADEAHAMSSQLLMGSAELLHLSGGTPGSLRKKVTTPNGVTAAAIESLTSGGIDNLLLKAITQGAERSRELGKDSYQNK